MRRFLISGGGTGGHIFPAVAIANRIKREIPDAEILFIGADDKMEMKRVPEAGYNIVGLTIYGINRSLSVKGILKNIKLPFVLMKAMSKAKKTIREFNPDIAIGVGGFASGPALKSAAKLGVPTLIQEQNSYPGVTNKILSKTVKKICVAYEGLEKYFPAEKIVMTGNPVRDEILNFVDKDKQAYEFFGFTSAKKTLLVVGGSLGARTINECMANHIADIQKLGIQVIWQTGESYYKTISQDLLNLNDPNIKIVPFIKKMNLAYSVADIIVSRAGALAISELSIIGKPTILVPFPYAAEDHQTKNARALSDKHAAYLISDAEAKEKLYSQLMQLIENEGDCEELARNIKTFAQPEAIDKIFAEIVKVGKIE
ncbi:MAG: undecaprenyldiphospho-muramoylpentapeptide beta-N-acetylglucosaminyltransferase [Bacteroidales bacterium]|nr:undecaprenyldiphospho-muramoylpentapeptide beta-N-acetylglucosaminyltransferase [Bacteroidales bacterium]